jgi:hypothetical protein
LRAAAILRRPDPKVLPKHLEEGAALALDGEFPAVDAKTEGHSSRIG